MEAFGKKLTEARTSRGLDFDQVSRETNITRRYLEALEREDFSAFPGEPYVLGFLRNYCEYLGLNSNEIITTYKNLKIQEAPIPLKELMPERSVADIVFFSPKSPKIFIGVGAVVLVILIIIGIGSFAGKGKKPEMKQVAVAQARTPVSYEVSGTEFKQRVYTGDSMVITTPAGSYKIVVQGTAPSLQLDTPLGSRVIDLGQDILIDLSGDDQPDVKVFVADLFKNDPSKGADVIMTAGESLASSSALVSGSTVPVSVTDVTVPVPGSSSLNTKQQVLFEGGSAYPVTLNATFRGYCLFRYETDRTTRDERYYQKSELLTIQANNGIRIWASNGNSVKLQVVAGGKTVDLEVSRPGEIMVRDLKWLKDEATGRFKFVVMDID